MMSTFAGDGQLMTSARRVPLARINRSQEGGSMFKNFLAVFLLATGVLGWTASAQDARAVIDSASKALGVETLKSVQY